MFYKRCIFCIHVIVYLYIEIIHCIFVAGYLVLQNHLIRFILPPISLNFVNYLTFTVFEINEIADIFYYVYEVTSFPIP
jgi:hypothetical protein